MINGTEYYKRKIIILELVQSFLHTVLVFRLFQHIC